MIPVYKDSKLERKQASSEELEELQEKLQIRQRAPKKKKTAKEKISELPFAPVRMP